MIPPLEARAEILKKISLVFWSKQWHQKFLLKLTDLYYCTQLAEMIWLVVTSLEFFWISMRSMTACLFLWHNLIWFFFTIRTHLLHANLDDIIHKSFLWSLDISRERNFRSNCLWIGKASKVENILKGILDLIPWGVKAKVCWHHPAMFCLDTSRTLSRL